MLGRTFGLLLEVGWSSHGLNIQYGHIVLRCIYLPYSILQGIREGLKVITRRTRGLGTLRAGVVASGRDILLLSLCKGRNGSDGKKSRPHTALQSEFLDSFQATGANAVLYNREREPY